MKIYSKANSRWLCSGIQSTWWKWRFLRWRRERVNACKQERTYSCAGDNFRTDDLMNFPSFFTHSTNFFCVYVCGGRFDVVLALFPVRTHNRVGMLSISFCSFCSFHFISFYFYTFSACVYCEHWLRFETYIKFHSSDLLIVCERFSFVCASICPGCESTERNLTHKLFHFLQMTLGSGKIERCNDEEEPNWKM